MRSGIAILAFCTFHGFSFAPVHGFDVPAKTTTPYTYCIWYLPDPDKESFLAELEASPPDLFHLGYHIPFKGALGPTFGHKLFSDDILPPEEVKREVARIENVIQKMRAAGVEKLIPYVYTMAFFGQPDKRTGFFHFYDRWDDYRAFGLGKKPAADPSLWSQQVGPHQLGGGPEGILHYDPCINHPAWAEYLDLVVRQIASLDYNGMFFDVNTLYCYCPHCQEKFDIYLLKKYGSEGLREVFGTDDHRVLNLSTIYRDFEHIILRAFKPYLAKIWERDHLGQTLGAKDTSEVKLDEDWRLLRCYMQGSRGEYPPASNFDEYLVDRFGSKQVEQISAEKKNDFVQTILRYHFHEFLESDALATLLENRFASSDIRRRCSSNPRDLLLWVETQRFWCESMASQFARLKRIGRMTFAEHGRGDDFYTVANLGSMATMDALNKRRVDAIDLVHWAPVADLQMFEEMQQPGSLESGVIISNIFAFRWAMAAGTKAGTLLYKVSDDRAADLAEAEVAAGGGGAFIQPGVGAPESRKRWKRFFSDHADLWDEGSSWAKVGLLFWSDQVFYEYPEHDAITRRLVHVLSENQIPFDIITEENSEDLASYDVLVVPRLRYLDDAQISQLFAYANQGGRLVIIEPFGTEDKLARPRQKGQIDQIAFAADRFQAVRYGKGQVLRLKEEDVPARLSDQWCLMEERAGSFPRAKDYLERARRVDSQKGVDLGGRFVGRLESSLGLQLRWCPPETNPGVYVHAYRLPAKHGRPERIVAHLVNYRVPILLDKSAESGEDAMWLTETKAGEPAIIERLRITIPLSRGMKVKQAYALSPTDKAGPAKWSSQSGQAVFVVDRLKIYQALVLELAASD